MGLFFNAKNNKEKWASVVMPSSNAKEIPTATLEAATALFIQQHARILAESIRLFLTSKNKDTRKLLWSSFFVTLLAKKYHYSIMQLPLLHAG